MAHSCPGGGHGCAAASAACLLPAPRVEVPDAFALWRPFSCRHAGLAQNFMWGLCGCPFALFPAFWWWWFVPKIGKGFAKMFGPSLPLWLVDFPGCVFPPFQFLLQKCYQCRWLGGAHSEAFWKYLCYLNDNLAEYLIFYFFTCNSLKYHPISSYVVCTEIWDQYDSCSHVCGLFVLCGTFFSDTFL